MKGCQMLNRKNDILSQINATYINKSKAESTNIEENSDTEMMEYKQDFYEMSLGSLRAIAAHANKILNSLDRPHVKENLTESWLQGKIAITEDYMRTIHDFIMYVSEESDSVLAADRPGLWENIRRKKQREGDDYRPAKPGDKDRPNKDQWKKLTNTSMVCDKCGNASTTCSCS